MELSFKDLVCSAEGGARQAVYRWTAIPVAGQAVYRRESFGGNAEYAERRCAPTRMDAEFIQPTSWRSTM